MRGLWDRWRLQLPARSPGSRSEAPLPLCGVFSPPTQGPVPPLGADGARQLGTFTPTRGMPLLPSSKPAKLGTEGICSDLSWSCLVQELELNQIKS